MAHAEALAAPPRLAPRALLAAGAAVYVAVLAIGWWATLHVLPDAVTLRLAGHAVTIANLHSKVLGNAGLLFAVLPAALWLECLVVGWERSSTRDLLLGPTASMQTDLSVLVLGQARLLDLLGHLMMLGVSMISGLWIREAIHRATGLQIDASGLPLVVQIGVYFFVYSFFDYWTHRFDHSPYFWPLHRYHHAAQDFCVVNAGRQHPAAFVGVFVINLPMAVLGASPAVMIYVNLLVTTLGFVIHSRIDSDWGWVGRWVIQSPVHHRLHHKLDMSYPTGHFAIAPIWDRLFGTWNGKSDPRLEIGVSRSYRHGLWVAPDLLRDYWHFWKGLATRRPIE